MGNPKSVQGSSFAVQNKYSFRSVTKNARNRGQMLSNLMRMTKNASLKKEIMDQYNGHSRLLKVSADLAAIKPIKANKKGHTISTTGVHPECPSCHCAGPQNKEEISWFSWTTNK